MKNKTVIVTGGSSGMGKYMAQKFANEGSNVLITGRTESRLKDVKDELMKQATGDISVIPMDVRGPEDVAMMVTETVAMYGGIDYLVNNAAGNFISPAEDLTINGWNAVIDIILNGTFYSTREVGNYWIKQQKRGAILNMVATYAWNAGVGVVHNSAAKAGVLNMTRTLAVEWGTKYGIRVNAIAPGPIERTGGAENNTAHTGVRTFTTIGTTRRNSGTRLFYPIRKSFIHEW